MGVPFEIIWIKHDYSTGYSVLLYYHIGFHTSELKGCCLHQCIQSPDTRVFGKSNHDQATSDDHSFVLQTVC